MKAAVFCDFDGTVTAEESFVAVLRRFAPTLAATLIPEIYALRLPLRVGVRQMLESMPSTAWPEICAYAATVPLRPGLPALLDALAARGVPFVLVSGGLRGMVEAALAPWRHQITAIVAVDIDTSGPLLRVQSPFEGPEELVDKVAVMQHFFPDASQRIVIGDSVTDLNMALAAQRVYARDRLCGYLDERGKPWRPWSDFHEIRADLEAWWTPETS